MHKYLRESCRFLFFSLGGTSILSNLGHYRYISSVHIFYLDHVENTTGCQICSYSFYLVSPAWLCQMIRVKLKISQKGLTTKCHLGLSDSTKHLEVYNYCMLVNNPTQIMLVYISKKYQKKWVICVKMDVS